MHHKFTDILEVTKRDIHQNDIAFWNHLGITIDQFLHDGGYPVQSFVSSFDKKNKYLTYLREFQYCYGFDFISGQKFMYCPYQVPEGMSNIIPSTEGNQWFYRYPKKNKTLWIVDNYVDGRILLNSGKDVRGMPYPMIFDYSIIEEYYKNWDTVNFFLHGTKNRVYKTMSMNKYPVNYYTISSYFLSRNLKDLKGIAFKYGGDVAIQETDNLVLL